MIYFVKIINKWVLFFITAFAVIFIFFVVILISANQDYVIVIDPGHGGTDSGAVGKDTDKTLEKNINLAVALNLKEYLEASDIKVFLTRQTDDDTDGIDGFHKRKDLNNRLKTAQSHNADLYVSIHMNSTPSGNDLGFQAFYGTVEGSNKLAEKIFETVTNSQICNRVREIKKAPKDLYIYKNLSIPSVLIECGFISNTKDLSLLKNSDYQQKIAYTLYMGIIRYLKGISE